jgi:mgtE-like transporter
VARGGASPLRPIRAALRFWREEQRALVLGGVALLVAATADLGAGVVLSSADRRIAELPGLLLLVPAAIAMRGATFGAFGARLGTALAVGTYDPELRPGSWLWRHVEAVTILTLVTSVEAAGLAWVVARATGQDTVGVGDLVAVSTVGGLLASLALLGVTLTLARQSSLRGWSMDDVGAPAITATGDLLTIPALLLATTLTGRGTVTTVLAVALTVLTVVLAAYGWVHPRRDVRRLLQESMVVLTGAALVSVLAGAVLEGRDDLFLAIPALLLLFPPFVAAFGSLGGILASRLTSRLHLGLLPPTPRPNGAIGLEASMTFLFATGVYLYVGAATWGLARTLGIATPSLVELLGVAVIGGLMGTTLLVLVATTAATATYRLGLDPDNHAIPVVTSVMDFLGMLCLVGAVTLLQVGAT